jgi:hypothetical protein
LQIEHSDSDTLEFVDSAAMSFMVLTVSRLNEALVANGVANAELRRSICASFLFDFAYHHDAGWLVHDDRRLYPITSFAEREAPRGDENLGAITRLHVPTDASSWHEYAHGVVSQFFEDDREQVSEIRFGSYDLE